MKNLPFIGADVPAALAIRAVTFTPLLLLLLLVCLQSLNDDGISQGKHVFCITYKNKHCVSEKSPFYFF